MPTVDALIIIQEVYNMPHFLVIPTPLGIGEYTLKKYIFNTRKE